MHGHLHVIRWAIENGCPWDSTNLCSAVVRAETADAFEWAANNGCDTSSLWLWAVKSNNLKMLEYALSLDPTTVNVAVNYAVKDPRALRLILLKDKNKTISNSCFNMTIRKGSFECLRMLYDHGIVYDGRSAIHASMFGKLHVLKWLKAKGAPMDERILIQAIQNSDKRMIDWAVKHVDRHSDVMVFHAIISHPCLEQIKCMVDCGLKLTPQCCNLCIERHADPIKLKALEILLSLGCDVDSEFAEKISHTSMHQEYTRLLNEFNPRIVLD